jgi:hypothetical protein
VLVARADPDTVRATLGSALLTNDELAAGTRAWRQYPNPFGHRHADPCEQTIPAHDTTEERE